MKLAFTGKGGVGKTSISAALSLYLASVGKKVLAVDVDPDANLATALGMPFEEAKNIEPISHMRELVKERTGAEPGAAPGFFTLNPKVDDIPEKYSKDINGVKLMVMGSIESGGGGCICPENSLTRALIKNLLIERNEVVVLDMEAGIEHLGRSTAEAVDAMLVVIEPGQRSIETAKRIKSLASEIGIQRLYLILNKVDDEKQLELAKRIDMPLLAVISNDLNLKKADQEDKAVYPLDEKFDSEIKDLADKLIKQNL